MVSYNHTFKNKSFTKQQVSAYSSYNCNYCIYYRNVIKYFLNTYNSLIHEYNYKNKTAQVQHMYKHHNLKRG